jgi:peptidoglycan/xylan/chitin deacetylase (PgdA/CDA1 family)
VRGALILGYHRVSEPLQFDRALDRGLDVAPPVFRRHLTLLAGRFSIVSLDHLLSRLESQASVDGLAAVTLDDGYVDNYVHAFPILSELGIPATVFLTTDNIEHARPFWTERLAAYLGRARGRLIAAPKDCGGPFDLTTDDALRGTFKRLILELSGLNGARRDKWLDRLGAEAPATWAPVSWDQVRQMHRGGIAFGAHTKSHPSLVKLSDDDARQEIAGSRDLLHERLGVLPSQFAYPFGHADARVGRIVEAEGFRGAVTADGGRCWPGSHLAFLPRVIVGSWSEAEFERVLDRMCADPEAAPARGSVASRLARALPRPAVAALRSARSAMVKLGRRMSHLAGQPESAGR